MRPKSAPTIFFPFEILAPSKFTLFLSAIALAFGVSAFVLATPLYPQSVPAHSNSAGTINKAYIDDDGNVHIVDSDGKETKPSKEKGQVRSDSILVAEDKETVGWLAQFPNCCTSYPIALTLVIWREGRIVHRFGDGMLIASWHFVAGGKQVAFYSNTVHGDFAPHYELRDTKAGRLLGKWDGSLTKDAPKWAQELSD